MITGFFIQKSHGHFKCLANAAKKSSEDSSSTAKTAFVTIHTSTPSQRSTKIANIQRPHPWHCTILPSKVLFQKKVNADFMIIGQRNIWNLDERKQLQIVENTCRFDHFMVENIILTIFTVYKVNQLNSKFLMVH